MKPIAPAGAVIRIGVCVALTLLTILPASASTLSAAGWSAEIRDGRVVSLTNRLTGETTVRPGAAGSPAGLQRLGEELDASKADRRSERHGPGWLEQTAIWLNRSGSLRARLRTRFEIDRGTGDLLVTQRGEAEEKGLYGAAWAIGDVRSPAEVLVPGNSGQRFASVLPSGRRVFDYRQRVFDYPTGWEAAFALIQGRRGGFIVRAADPDYRYKTLTLDQAGSAFRLRFESRNEAPFQHLGTIVSSRWRMAAYRGDWQHGAAIYAKWMRARYPLEPLARKQPAWARNIQFVVTMAMDIPTLRLLAQRCDPTRTLLYLADWRAFSYDRNYPDYTAAPAFGPFVQEAHRLGFHVMAHTDYFGCAADNPAYAAVKQYQLRDPITGELQWWDWERADPPIKFAYIDPASRAWRRIFVGRMVDLYRRYHIDAIHLDVSLVIINDGIGRVDGMNMIEGNLALHRDLRQALPQVALSGEGLNEITCRYEQFAQRHLYGMNHADGIWNDSLIAMCHPVSSAILTPYTRLYGYLGLANPNSGDLYTAWMRGYENFGVIPTLCWPDTAQLESPTPAVAALLAQARLFQREQPVPDFETPWKPNDIFVYRLADGRHACYRRDQGVLFAIRERDGRETLLSRRIEGVSTARTTGSVPGWPAYDGMCLLGLDPRRTYAWSPAPPDMSALHVAAMPEGLFLRQNGIHKQFARFRFDAPSSTIRLWEFEGKCAGGVKLADGTVRRFEGLAFEDPATSGNCHPDDAGFFIHPPWRGPADQANPRPGGARHVTFMEFTLTLPDRPDVGFSAGVHLDPNAVGKSDGVTFRVVARCGEEITEAERHNATAKSEPLTLDLSRFRGRVVCLRLEADPGPTGNPSFDWGRIDGPCIVSTAPAAASAATIEIDRVKLQGEPAAAFGTTQCSRIGTDRLRLRLPMPNTLILPLAPPLPARPDCDLLDTPYVDSVLLADGMERPTYSFYKASVDRATCNGTIRRALHLHPPESGRTLADWWLQLPAEPVRLVTAAGIRDGAKSAGVTFEIQVNGERLFRKALMPGTGWTPVEIDLNAWKGQPVLLTIITEAEGRNDYDWAVWAEPQLRSAGR